MANFTPNTGTALGPGRTNSGLSTQIIIRVNDQPVGAIQKLDVKQSRKLQRITEIGTDGVIEITPNGAAEYSLSVQRIVFDQLRLPEAMSRGFRFIGAQRLAFDIDIIDMMSVGTPDGDPTPQNGAIVMTYKNCWFERMDTPYSSDNYVITETADIQAETAFISAGTPPKNIRGLETVVNEIEAAANKGDRRGSMDASGLWNSLFGND
jgi:hypothetical protein